MSSAKYEEYRNARLMAARKVETFVFGLAAHGLTEILEEYSIGTKVGMLFETRNLLILFGNIYKAI